VKFSHTYILHLHATPWRTIDAFSCSFRLIRTYNKVCYIESSLLFPSLLANGMLNPNNMNSILGDLEYHSSILLTNAAKIRQLGNFFHLWMFVSGICSWHSPQISHDIGLNIYVWFLQILFWWVVFANSYEYWVLRMFKTRWNMRSVSFLFYFDRDGSEQITLDELQQAC